MIMADSAGSAAQGTSQNSSEPCSDDKKGHEEGPAVRFSSSVEEIAPEPRDADATSKNKEETPSSFTEVAADKLKAITQQMQYAPLQERRMSTFQFEPYSLPASRVRLGSVVTPNRVLSMTLATWFRVLFFLCLSAELSYASLHTEKRVMAPSGCESPSD